MTSSTRVAVVTGANKGIGLAIVKLMCARFDGVVYLTSRDEARGRAAVEQLKELGCNPRFHQLDIDDDASIIRFRDHLKTSYGGLDVLVNNAGVLLERENTGMPFAVKASRTLRTNFFSLVIVCDLLFPLLRPHARVVNVASSCGHLTHIKGQELAAVKLRNKLASPDLTKEELNALVRGFVDAAQTGEHEKLGWKMRDVYFCYKVSKIAVVALTRIQQRIFDHGDRPDLVVNAVHPGFVDSDMTAHQGPLTTEKGAEAPCWLALLPPNTKDIKGAFVWHDKTIVDWISGPMPNQLVDQKDPGTWL